MSLIEKYSHEGAGYNPFLIREGWQVAQLNYVAGQGFDDIQLIEVHNNTDEVFILFVGTAILIAAEKQDYNISYEMILMEPGVVYNIPKGVWHNISMSRDAQVMIIENDNTHLCDFEYHYLNDAQKADLYQQIAALV